MVRRRCIYLVSLRLLIHIRSLGMKTPELQTARRVGLDYPMAAANAFRTALGPPLTNGRRFRFFYLRGRVAENY